MDYRSELEELETKPHRVRAILNDALERAGGPTRLGEKVGIKYSTLSYWRRGAVKPSDESVIKILNWLIEEDEVGHLKSSNG